MEGLASIPGTDQGHSSMGLQTVSLHMLLVLVVVVGSTPTERNHRDSGAYVGSGKSLTIFEQERTVIKDVFKRLYWEQAVE